MAVKTSTLLIGGGIAAAIVYMMTRQNSRLDLPAIPTPAGATSISLESPAAPDINLAIESPQAAPSGGLDLASIFALLSLNQSQPVSAPAPVIVLPPAPVAAPPPVAAPAFDFAGFLAGLLGSGDAAATGENGQSGQQEDQGATDSGPVDQVDFNRDGFLDIGGFTELELDNIFGFSNPVPSPAPAPAPIYDFGLDITEELGGGFVGDTESPLARLSRLLGIPIPSSDLGLGLDLDVGSIDLPNFGDVVPLNPDGTVKFGFPELVDPFGNFQFPELEVPRFEVPSFNPFSGLLDQAEQAGQDVKVVSEGLTGFAYLGSKLPVAGKILTKLPIFGIASKAFLPLTVLDLLVTGYEFYTGNNVPVLGNRELIQGLIN